MHAVVGFVIESAQLVAGSDCGSTRMQKLISLFENQVYFILLFHIPGNRIQLNYS